MEIDNLKVNTDPGPGGNKDTGHGAVFHPDPSFGWNKINLHFNLNWRDPSLWSLLFSNLLTISFVLSAKISFGQVVLIYWFQSVIIGLFNIVRILNLKNFSTEGFTSNGSPVPADKRGKTSTATFFFVHYGFFHLVYLLVLSGELGGESFLSAVMAILPAVAVFFLNHLYSFLRNFQELTTGGNLGRIMFTPYARIIPMHLTIGAFSTLGQFAIVPFMAIKTLVDVLSHIFKHRIKS